MKKTQTPRKTLAAGIARVLKRLHFPKVHGRMIDLDASLSHHLFQVSHT
jgi:hypothetical protein